MKLLIADDKSAMRALLRQCCASVATEVRDCTNGVEAITLFNEFHPDWTLMDLMMPEMDGLTATARIMALSPDARIIIVTQQRSPEYREAALQAGASALVLKDNLHLLPQLLVQNPTPQSL
jgi:CheY-like chemotaxis protein